MNKTIQEIKQLMEENRKQYLPEVKESELEENGTIYYMNGKNGTEFDWYVNDKISDFMMFYNDEKNLGAMKCTLYKDGQVYIYVYGENGNKLIQEVRTCCKALEKEILDLAVILKKEADDKRIFDASIEKITTDSKIEESQMKEFEDNEKYYETARNRKRLLNLRALVSKKITEEGWKVGYMVKNKPLNESDSGWHFFAGDEEESYLATADHIEVVSIASVCQLDADIVKYLDSPIGTSFIRISSNEFEIDTKKKRIYMEKR